ncbi:Fanconi anemia group J protein [Echinococcus multilocularis]|uniref:Fanconi anemia group J protein n=1 Tax=Echinococcus multilocularis TaxID=6211 RepID=A0A068YF26_ECHMU|nr:Fanconi anemia group J protein [Echinococcus multilocularis]
MLAVEQFFKVKGGVLVGQAHGCPDLAYSYVAFFISSLTVVFWDGSQDTGCFYPFPLQAGCLLESPTGTGKTLALLCATLGWLEHQMGKGSKSVERGGIVRLKTCKLLAFTQNEQGDDFVDFMEGNVRKVPSLCTCGAAESRPVDENASVSSLIINADLF